MNLVETFQDLVAKVPEFLQPLIVALAGAIPFIEGEGAALIGIFGGMNVIVAGVAATLGSFAAVAIVVFVTARTRQALVSRRARKVPAVAGVAAGAAGATSLPAAGHTDHTDHTDPTDLPQFAGAPESARKQAKRAKFNRTFERYGLPGVSLLGPLLLPPVFTATMLVAVGINTRKILIWQAIGIVLWVVLSCALSGVAVDLLGS